MTRRAKVEISNAVTLVEGGMSPWKAATVEGVSTTGVLRAMRRKGVASKCPRCAGCGRPLPKQMISDGSTAPPGD